MRFDSDHETVFRQESYFAWAFGVMEQGCFGAIDIATAKATIFMPRLGKSYAIWMGKLKPVSHYREKYGVEEALYVDEIPEFMLCSYADATVHVLCGVNTDSGNVTVTTATFESDEAFTIDRDTLHPHAAECRVFKSAAEIELMRHVSQVSSAAHVDVMRYAKPGMTEYQLESRFHHYCYTNAGFRNVAYTCICACGPNSSTLHYGHAGAPNDREMKATDMALLDMGGEYHCYCSDITCSFPIGGIFSDNQRMMYNGVLEAVRAVECVMKPGVVWTDMQDLASRVLLKALVADGCLHGNIDEMMEAQLGAIFLPCGLGHFIGLDTHDVGGYNPGCPKRPQKYGANKLRTARVLEPGMIITVEPGMYFIEVLLDSALESEKQSKFFNRDRLQELRHLGGVRIEDVVVITKDGIDNLTQCPRSIEEVESVMAGGVWPPNPKDDPLPDMKRHWTDWKTPYSYY